MKEKEKNDKKRRNFVYDPFEDSKSAKKELILIINFF